MTHPADSAGGPSAGDRRRTAWILSATSLFFTLVITFWYLRSPDGFFTDTLGINDGAWTSFVPWVLGAAIAVAYATFTVRGNPVVDRHKLELSPLKLVGIWVAVGRGVVEEAVFRQLLMDALFDRGAGSVVQVAVSAVVFGVAHALWVFLGGDFKIARPVVVATTLLCAALAVLYLVADRNVLPAIIAHIGINLVIEPWLILAAVSGRFLTDQTPKR